MLGGSLLRVGTRVIKKGGKVVYKGGRASVGYLAKKGEEERLRVKGEDKKGESGGTPKEIMTYKGMEQEITSDYGEGTKVTEKVSGKVTGDEQVENVGRLTTEQMYKILDRLFLQPNIFCNWSYDKKKDRVQVSFDKETDVYYITNRGLYNEDGENILERDISETITKLTLRQREKHHKAIIIIVGMFVKLGYIGE